METVSHAFSVVIETTVRVIRLINSIKKPNSSLKVAQLDAQDVFRTKPHFSSVVSWNS